MQGQSFLIALTMNRHIRIFVNYNIYKCVYHTSMSSKYELQPWSCMHTQASYTDGVYIYIYTYICILNRWPGYATCGCFLIQVFNSLKQSKLHLKTSSAKWWPSCFSLNATICNYMDHMERSLTLLVMCNPRALWRYWVWGSENINTVTYPLP